MPRGRPRKPRMDAAVDAMVPFGFSVEKVKKHVKQEIEEEQLAVVDSNPSKIQWEWKRQSFQGKKAKVDLFVRFKFIDQIRTQLTDIDRPGMYDAFATSCFGRFLHFFTGGSCNGAALHALLGREVSRSDSNGADEFWFRIGDRFIRFSKYEFALVTGLRFGDSGFELNASHAIPSDGVYMRRVAGSRRVAIKTIYDRFVMGEFADSVDDQVKIAKILFVYKILLGVVTHKVSVDDWVWALIEDDEAWESFPWGKFSYQALSHRLRGLPTSQPGDRIFRYNFHGFSPVLLIWAYEAIPQFGRIYGDRVDDEDLQRPRLIRWRMNRKKLNDMTNLFDRALECHERLEPSAEELDDFARHHVDDDLGAGIQYVHRESSTIVGGRVDVGGSRGVVRALVGCGRIGRHRVRGTKYKKGVGSRRAKRARVVLHEDEGASDPSHSPPFVSAPSTDLLQRIMVMFQSDVDRVLDKITGLETHTLGRLGGLERRVDALERSLQPVVKEKDKSSAGNSARDEGPKNNSLENIVAIESGINSGDGKGWRVILPDQTIEETGNAVRRSETTNSHPPHGRLPCYGWIESDDEDDFVFLEHAHALEEGTKSHGKRRSRWNLKPDDPY